MTMPTQSQTYFAFGLGVRSEVPLPELPPSPLGGPVDVEIRLDVVPAGLPGAREVEEGVFAAGDAMLLSFPEARYLVRGGREIRVQPAPGASARDVRSYIFGSAMGAICHQRGLLPMHANAIDFDGRAIAFSGRSGAGKSTLAAHFHGEGRRILSDDLCVVTFDGAGRPLAWPGLPRIKLWDDALAALGHDARGLDRVSDGEAKFSLPMPDALLRAPLPLARLYALEATDGDGIEIVRLRGRDAIDAAFAGVYRWEFAVATGRSAVQFRQILALVDAIGVFAARRPVRFDRLAAQAKEMERHATADF
jgi:hypothetical protein